MNDEIIGVIYKRDIKGCTGNTAYDTVKCNTQRGFCRTTKCHNKSVLFTPNVLCGWIKLEFIKL